MENSIERQTGFSTIEIIIASLILGMVILGLAQGRRFASQSYENYTGKGEVNDVASELTTNLLQTGRRAVSCQLVGSVLECKGGKPAAAACTGPKVRFTFLPAENRVSYSCETAAIWTELHSYSSVADFLLCDDAMMGLPSGVNNCPLSSDKISLHRWGMAATSGRYFRFRIQMQLPAVKGTSPTSEFQSAFFVRNPTGIALIVFQ